jgi:hypothetical protein
MIEQFGQYIVQAPLAVIVLAYIYFADRQKAKVIKTLSEQNTELLKLIGDLTKKR